MSIKTLILLLLIWLVLFHHLNTTQQINPAPQTVTGTIASIPTTNPHAISFVLNSNIGKLKLSWFNNHQTPHFGEHWCFTVKLKTPHGYHNPGGFNFEKWLKSQHIIAVGYVVNKAHHKKLKDARSLRATIYRSITQQLHENAYRDIVLAITLGFNSLLTPEHKRTFQQTGTSHLMAISGLHVGMVAGVVFALVGLLTRLLPNMLRYCPKQKIAAVFAISSAFAYSALAGFSVSTQRAVIMLTVTMIGYYFFSKQSLAKSLLFAFIIVLLLDPMAIYAVGFWLSFAAVFFLIYTMTGRIGTPTLWWQWGWAQLVCSVALIPLTAWIFHMISLTSLIANLIAIPVVSFIVVPVSLLGVLTTCKLFFTVATFTLHYLLVLLSKLAFGQVYFALHSSHELFFAMLAVLVLLAPAGLKIKPLAIFFLLPIFFPQQERIQKGRFALTVLDVGQGLSCLIQTKTHTLLYDAGPKFDAFDSGQNIIVPYCQFKRIKQIDTIVISHADNDHIGGLQSILTAFTPTTIYSSVPLEMHHNAQLCDRNVYWQWDGVTFQFLNNAKQQFKKDNNNSCVLKVIGTAGSVLLTGDIEKQAEKFLLKENIQSSAIVVPHHGSKTSSTEKFIEAVHPRYALFSYGYLNRFHHPNPVVLGRYEDLSVITYSTVNQGAIKMLF